MSLTPPTVPPRALGLLLLLAACRAPQAPQHTPAPLALPEAWAAEHEDSVSAARLAGWWRSFKDPQLDVVVERVLQANLDLRASAARLQGAQAQARMAGAALWPALGVNGDAGRQRVNFVGLPIPGATDRVLSSTSSNFGVSLNVSWELDLWGKLEARERAAAASYRASAADHAAAQLSLAGQAAKAWFALNEAKLQRVNAAQTVEAYEQSTAILRGRFAERGSTALDLRLAESQLATARAVLAGYEQSVRRVVRQLEFLAGDYPAGELQCAGRFPDLPPSVSGVLPGELLQRRPDLISAEEQLKSADLELYAARKELYPSLSLSGSLGRRSADGANLPDNDFDVWSLVGNISAPLFQGGRLRAQVDFEQASVQAALQSWASRLLNAFFEVENALAAESPLEQREANLGLATQHAQAARQLAEERYTQGRIGILVVLDARQRAFINQSAQISAQRARLDLRVDLFLALGGGFGEAPPHSPSTDGQPIPRP